MLDPARLAEAFALGQPQGPLALVPGAWSNRLWRQETEQGRFAVKEVLGPAAAGEWPHRLQVAMTVERAAWTAGTRLAGCGRDPPGEPQLAVAEC